jgi:hypothetical protein
VVRADIFSEIEDILVEQSHTYVAIADLSVILLYFEVNIDEQG